MSIKYVKIKDNIDLKELENFGFLKDINIKDGLYYYRWNNFYIGDNRLILQDDGINHYRSLEEWNITEYDLDKLFDLIKADLVERK